MTATDRLCVLIAGKVAGEAAQSDNGKLTFTYEDGYSGIPLSLSMPVSNRVFSDKAVRPYLFGLLPDDKAVRTNIARQFEASASNPLALLAHIGLDCPGAVQLCRKEDLAQVLARPKSYVALSDADIAGRLKNLRASYDDPWMGRDEHWSLGGNQGKFALALRDGAWCECQGAAPTTHIFKNGIAGYRLQALNEYICMRLAQRCGLPSAYVEYRVFEDEPAIIVSRYDRLIDADGDVVRLHQEDLCQALGVMPDQKYTSDGGPNASDVLRLLASTPHAADNIALFAQMLFFNCLIGAPDAHAKNYSLILTPGPDALVAPLYDVASGLAYDTLRRKGRLAMSIGGENRFGRMSGNALERFTRNGGIDELGFDRAWCLETMAGLANMIIDRLGDVFDEAAAIPGRDELRDRLERPIADNCRTILAQLGA